MQKNKTLFIARAGIISALYAGLSFLTLPLASGAVQVRLAEGLSLLPVIMLEAVPGVFVGCLIVNFVSGCVLVDTVVGSLVTLLSAILSYAVGRFIKKGALKIFIAGLFPVLLNAFILPIIWIFYAQTEYLYHIQVLLLIAGQTLAVYGVGVPLVVGVRKFIKKNKI